jgi:hypothetical protein
MVSTIFKSFYWGMCVAYFPFGRHQNFIIKHNLYKFSISLVVRISEKISMCIYFFSSLYLLPSHFIYNVVAQYVFNKCSLWVLFLLLGVCFFLFEDFLELPQYK